jgi:hypothetical protein
LLSQRKKNKFKASGVKTNVPRMLMVHHQDVFVEMSTRLQTAQQEIQKHRDQLRDSDVTIRVYQRMVAGEASDFYKALVHENRRGILERKRKMQHTGPQGSNTRVCVGSSLQGPNLRSGEQIGHHRMRTMGQGCQTP